MTAQRCGQPGIIELKAWQKKALCLITKRPKKSTELVTWTPCSFMSCIDFAGWINLKPRCWAHASHGDSTNTPKVTSLLPPTSNSTWLVLWNMAFKTFHFFGNVIIPTVTPSFFRCVGLNHRPDKGFIHHLGDWGHHLLVESHEHCAPLCCPRHEPEGLAHMRHCGWCSHFGVSCE